MKIKKLSVIALLLTVVMLFGACSVGEIKSTEEEARVVAYCGDHEIRYEELRYLVVRYKADFSAQYGENVFEDAETGAEYEETLRVLVEAALRDSYAIVDQCETRQIRAGDKVTRQEVQEYVDETVELLGGRDEYLAYLDANGMNDTVFRFNTAILSCQYRYYEALAEEKDREAYDAVLAGDGFIRTVSIFVKNDPGENEEENRAMAQTVVDAVRAGASVEDYIGTRYNQDTSDCDYVFMRGYFIEEYEDVAFALDIDEVSDVVETADGFYVIQRRAVESDYFGANVDTLKAMYLSCLMNDETRALAQSMTVTWAENAPTLWSLQ